MKLVLCFIVIFLSFNSYFIQCKDVRCLSNTGSPVDWWFIFAKQSKSLLGGGYLYVDSNNNYIDYEEGSGDDGVVPLYQIIQQHTDKAFADNTAVFQKCTQSQTTVLANNQACTDELNGQSFVSQTWFHDTLDVHDNINRDVSVEEIEDINEDTIEDYDEWYKETEKKSEARQKNLDEKSETKEKNKYSEEYTPPGTKKDNKKKRGGDEILPKAADNTKYTESIPDTFRKAHSKYLVSYDINTKNGYLLDHSANIPSFFNKIGSTIKVFEKPKLFSDTDDPGSSRATKQKFLLSHHFFCFNFQHTEFYSLIDLIKSSNPRFVKSNYMDANHEVSFLNNEFGNVKNLYSYLTTDPYVAGDTCEAVYKSMKPEEIDSATRLKAHFKKMFDNQANILAGCAKEVQISDSVYVLGMNARNKLNGIHDKAYSIDSTISPFGDGYTQKFLLPHLSIADFGLDPFTLLAFKFSGSQDHYFVSTFKQPTRIQISSFQLKAPAIKIDVVESWGYGTGNKVMRHEKILFSAQNAGDDICVGDANRNLVHTLYAGIYICFKSNIAVEKLQKYINSYNTQINMVNPYKTTAQSPTSKYHDIKTVPSLVYPIKVPNAELLVSAPIMSPPKAKVPKLEE